MGVVVDPFPRSRNPLSRRDHGGVSDNRDQVAMSARLDPQNTKAVVAIMEGDTLDKASQNLLGSKVLVDASPDSSRGAEVRGG
jgi:hypothetical protein